MLSLVMCKVVKFLFLLLISKLSFAYVNVYQNLSACTVNSDKIHICVGNCFSPVCARFKRCVLFALREVRRHAWSALHCLTVVFSRCHWLGVLCRGDGIMCSGPSWVQKRAELQRPQLSHSRLPRHLIVRKVSAEPSGPGGSTASLSAGQTERHSVLGPNSQSCFIDFISKFKQCINSIQHTLKLKAIKTGTACTVLTWSWEYDVFK